MRNALLIALAILLAACGPLDTVAGVMSGLDVASYLSNLGDDNDVCQAGMTSEPCIAFMASHCAQGYARACELHQLLLQEKREARQMRRIRTPGPPAIPREPVPPPEPVILEPEPIITESDI